MIPSGVSVATPPLIHFADLELDLRRYELRREGRVLKLERIPMDLLVFLVQERGRLVTREEIVERIWGKDVVLDTENAINTAIRKVRLVLKDDPSQPRFLETAPGKGYRFIAQAVMDKDEPVYVKPRLRRLKAWSGAAGLLAVSAASVAVFWLRQPLPPEPRLAVRRFTIRPPVPIATAPFGPVVAISPDGRHIAFIGDEGKTRLWIQHLDQEQPQAIEGTEGVLGAFWSPDSKFAAFATTRALKRVPVSGGLATWICDLPTKSYYPTGVTFYGATFYGGAWSPDGLSIIFSTGDPAIVYEVPAAGGSARLLLSAELLKRAPEYIRNPQFLPVKAGPRTLVFAFGHVDSTLMIRGIKTGRQESLAPGDRPFCCANGYLVYHSTTEASELLAQPFSLDTLRPRGAAFPIARHATDPSFSADGTLAYLDAFSEKLVWVDRRGQKCGEIGQPAQLFAYPALSPDGRSVAVEGMENANLDIWIYNIARAARTRLTDDPATEILPVWSPGGEEVAYGSYRTGSIDIFVRRADAGTGERVLAATGYPKRVSDWSRDGQHIVYSLKDPRNGYDLWYLKRDGKGNWQPHPFLQTSANETMPKLSPDGRYVAYQSDESGRAEVYVRPFPEGNQKWAVSSNGGKQIRWSRNGREMFYVEGDTLVAVPVRTVPGFSMGPAARLFAHSAFKTWNDANYDVSANGERILLPERVGAQGREPAIHIVENWFTEVRERQR